ncbi:MAG: hypothetical protein GX410_04360 [Elusimicrobia bacterium]|nr:hypothetical protein [Elusimicrobiota bacterium]
MVTVCVAIIGLLGSCLTYYFTKKQQLELEQRKLKQAYYEHFLKALSDLANNNTDIDAQKRFSESCNSLIVIASPMVVHKLMRFYDLVCMKSHEEARDKHDEYLRDLIIAIRQDIYGFEPSANEMLSGIHLTKGGYKNSHTMK